LPCILKKKKKKKKFAVRWTFVSIVCQRRGANQINVYKTAVCNGDMRRRAQSKHGRNHKTIDIHSQRLLVNVLLNNITRR